MALSSSDDHSLGVFTTFDIEITLTKKGLEKYEDVIAAVFKYA